MMFRVSVFPTGQKEALDVLTQSGLPFTPSSAGSIVEGEWDDVVCALGDVYRAVREKHGRVFMRLDALDESESQEAALVEDPAAQDGGLSLHSERR